MIQPPTPMNAYDGLVNMGYKDLYGQIFRRRLCQYPYFWGIAKTILVKLKRIRQNKFYLYL
ncbi:MAG: hypothetical protein LBF13_06490 [Campylobacteraceae bacterium]|nr:hypothetical protein [Campylobacteraceae bacterium]